MQPAIGDRVHYVSHGTPRRADGSQAFPPACRAAWVTQVHGSALAEQPDVGLCVINPTGLFFAEIVANGAQHEPGSWHTPEQGHER